MGLSGGGTKTTETKPWGPAQPYLLGGASAVKSAYDQNAGGIQDATGQITSLIPDMIEKYKAGDAGVNAARGYNTDVLGGMYLDSNPYLEDMISQTGDDVRNQMQAALGLRGQTGGSSYADIISRNLARNSGNMRYGAYNDERSRMATAAGQAPGLAAADVIQVTPMMQALNASLTPMQAAQGYAGSLGGLFSGYGTTTEKKSGNLGGFLGSVLGGLMGG